MRHGIMADALRTLPDAELDLECKLLARKLEALRLATTAIGVRLHERYTARLTELHAEIERRRC
jgi:hypothetical protein